MLKRLSSFLTLALLVLSSASISAQDTRSLPAETPKTGNRLVLASTSDKAIRFTSLGELIQIRLEVIGSSGEALFDSGFKSANVIDWTLSDEQGRQLTDGSFLCIVSVRDSSNETVQKLATV